MVTKPTDPPASLSNTTTATNTTSAHPVRRSVELCFEGLETRLLDSLVALARVAVSGSVGREKRYWSGLRQQMVLVQEIERVFGRDKTRESVKVSWITQQPSITSLPRSFGDTTAEAVVLAIQRFSQDIAVSHDRQYLYAVALFPHGFREARPDARKPSLDKDLHSGRYAFVNHQGYFLDTAPVKSPHLMGCFESDKKCWNCNEKGHTLKDCTKPRDDAATWQNIALDDFLLGYGPSKSEEYWKHVQKLRPGVVGRELWLALGLRSDYDVPEYVRRMRLFGMPPGYMRSRILAHLRVRDKEYSDEELLNLMLGPPEAREHVLDIYETAQDYDLSQGLMVDGTADRCTAVYPQLFRLVGAQRKASGHGHGANEAVRACTVESRGQPNVIGAQGVGVGAPGQGNGKAPVRVVERERLRDAAAPTPKPGAKDSGAKSPNGNHVDKVRRKSPSSVGGHRGECREKSPESKGESSKTTSLSGVGEKKGNPPQGCATSNGSSKGDGQASGKRSRSSSVEIVQVSWREGGPAKRQAGGKRLRGEEGAKWARGPNGKEAGQSTRPWQSTASGSWDSPGTHNPMFLPVGSFIPDPSFSRASFVAGSQHGRSLRSYR